MKSQKRIADRV
jgi:ADP-ribose pyrophosphatase